MNGEPVDSLISYFPETIKNDSATIEVKIDSSRKQYYSYILHSSKEPILFNYYHGHDIYRFLWIRAFQPPMIYTIHNKDKNVWLEIKMPRKVQSGNGYSTNYINDKKDSILIDNLATPKSNYAIYLKCILSLKEWITFETLLNENNFWNITPYYTDHGFDGSSWVIEAHLKNKYRVVERWSPESNFRKGGEYLISLSRIKEEIY